MIAQDWILLSIIFYIFAFLAVGFYAFVTRKASVFEPIGQYLFFVSLFSLPLPIRAWMTMEIEGNVSPFLPEFVSYIPIALVLTAFSLPMFAIGYYSRFARSLCERLPLLAERGLRGTRFAVLALVLLASLLIYLLTEEVGGIMQFLMLGYNSSEATFGRGYLAVGFPWLIVAMVALLDRYAVSRLKIDLLLVGVLLFTNLGIHIVTGNRNMIMYMAIVLVIFIHFRICRLSLKILIPVAVAGFVGLNIVGLHRTSNYDSLSEFIERSLNSAESIGEGSAGILYTLSIGEFVVPFETLPQMIRTIGVTEWPWMGWSYLRAPVYFIPSVIFSDRPLPLANWYVENYYGGGYGLNEGRQFYFLAEAYLNFGPIGVLLNGAIWGVLWGALHNWMLRGRDRYISGDFVTLLVGIPQQSISAVAFVLIMVSLFAVRRKQRLKS